MIRMVAGRCPTGRAVALQAEPVPVSSASAASIPNASITAADLRSILEHAFPARITVRDIQNEVAQFYGISPDYMRCPDRTGCREPRVSHPRQMAIYIAREVTPLSLSVISREFGGRHHTTLLHAIKAVRKRAKADPYTQVEIEVLRERFAA